MHDRVEPLMGLLSKGRLLTLPEILTMEYTLAYYDTELITAVKNFILQAFELEFRNLFWPILKLFHIKQSTFQEQCKALFVKVSGGRTMVEHSTHNIRMEGSNLAPRIGQSKWKK